jgi:hypothetical protein
MVTPSASPRGTYVLAFDDVVFEVDPRVGGRVTSFRLGGIEVLSGSQVDRSNWGSTLWTSPQSDWGWPPPSEFDDLPFEVERDAGAIALSGPPNDRLGIALIKRFSADPARGSILAEYGIWNTSPRSQTFAGWEVTRVPARGLTFFPTGASAGGALGVRRTGAATWYAHDPSVLTPEGAKSFADGTGGFVAHVANRVLFVKSFADLPPEAQAPGEGEIEIYGNDRYVEVEVQGPYAPIEPGATARWHVRWTLRVLPAEVRVELGNEELFAFAASVAREAREDRDSASRVKV